MNLSTTLKYYRKIHSLSQKALAQTLQVSTAQYSKIESGIHEPKYHLTLRILKTLSLDINKSILLLDAEAELYCIKNKKGK